MDDVQSLESYILSETNVQKLTISQDKEKYSVQLKGIPDYGRLGQRLKGDMKKINDYFKVSFFKYILFKVKLSGEGIRHFIVVLF